MCDIKNDTVEHHGVIQDVPTAPGRVVSITDGQHFGTEVYLNADGTYRFVWIDDGETAEFDRCVLILVSGELDQLDQLGYQYGCDASEGLALVGLEQDEPPPGFGEVIWDSDD